MIQVTVNGLPFDIDEATITYISANGTGSDIYTEVDKFETSVTCSENPTAVIALSPVLYALTNIQDSNVVITINYSGSNIGNNLTIGTGQYQKLSDTGSVLTAIASLPSLIPVGAAISSEAGFGTVSSVSYSVPANPLNLNLLRIVKAVDSYYNGSLISYNDNGAEPVNYYISITPSALAALVAAAGGGGLGWGASGNDIFNNNSGNVGIGTNTPASLLTVDDGDIEVANKNNGLILYSQDGTKYRITAADGGTLTVTAI
jgi:hypothetical protein